ncbi:DUF2280 domain-containing protein [Aurantiacibacter odishensis]|uniref:DUF2280 domain-containing protein n=1 Tax=Aurantiacibacter odishensis TaxID=1155476 RepID=UPI000E70C5EB|nr:DUF2280 domain-containing protein [Aurantiacibacter odishensis]
MTRIPEHVKRRLIEHLAAYRTPGTVAQMIRAEFGIDMTPRHVRAYDPTTYQFAAGERWRAYFEAARARFDREIAEIPIYYRAYRLHALEKIRQQAMEQGDLRLAMKVLKQAAEEVGDIFVNRAVRANKIDQLRSWSEDTAEPSEKPRIVVQRAIGEVIRMDAKDSGE